MGGITGEAYLGVSLTPADWHRRYTEQARWTADLRRYLFTQPQFRQARRVLEVGCGTGAVLSTLPSLLEGGAGPLLPSPTGRGAGGEGSETPPQNSGEFGGGWEGALPCLFGIDISLPSLTLARQHAPLAACACADAHHLPFPTASFDLVLAHFLLLWVQDPAGVLREMARLTRPGGIVLALAEPDYGGRVDYPTALAQIGAWQIASLQAQGADPNLGRRLAGLFTAAGLTGIQVGVLGGQWQPTVYDPVTFASEWQVIESDLASDPGAGVPRELVEHLRKTDELARRAGERILYVPTFYAWGYRPELSSRIIGNDPSAL